MSRPASSYRAGWRNLARASGGMKAGSGAWKRAARHLAENDRRREKEKPGALAVVDLQSRYIAALHEDTFLYGRAA